eukprot:GFKZ01007543.1.p2 GENE.GFKZ01007543.1~~GFKZ01007543.1.p2  ORF type:complete len:146 (-),score=19.16 GFKZ01007543.1:541-978(-)
MTSVIPEICERLGGDKFTALNHLERFEIFFVRQLDCRSMLLPTKASKGDMKRIGCEFVTELGRERAVADEEFRLRGEEISEHINKLNRKGPPDPALIKAVKPQRRPLPNEKIEYDEFGTIFSATPTTGAKIRQGLNVSDNFWHFI